MSPQEDAKPTGDAGLRIFGAMKKMYRRVVVMCGAETWGMKVPQHGLKEYKWSDQVRVRDEEVRHRLVERRNMRGGVYRKKFK